MNIGIDQGYYAVKTRHFSFPAGVAAYSHEPYTLQNTLEIGVRDWPPAYPAGQNRVGQLLPADPDGCRQGAEAAGRKA